MRSRLALLETNHIDWLKATEAARGLSHAEISRAREYAAKNAILGNTLIADTVQLVTALKDRHITHH